jgi:hypothetical protein
MKLRFKNLKLVVFLFFISLFGLVAGESQAACSTSGDCPKAVNLIFRDDDGKFIPDVSFEIYYQVDDVDGRPKPSGNSLGSGDIDPILGRGSVCWGEKDLAHVEYALKVYHKNANEGVFWFYDTVNLSCGEVIDIEKQLSSIEIILRDARGELRKGTDISLYTQRHDVDGDPIREKDDFIAKLNTSAEGEAVTYIPTRERAIDGDGSRYHMFEVEGSDGGIFTKYDIRVIDKRKTMIHYIFSDIVFTLKDSEGNMYPSGSKIEIFKQVKDHEGDRVMGESLKTEVTNDEGVAIFEYPEGMYVARVKSASGQYEYFWDLKINDQESVSITLQTKEEWEPPTGTCAEKSELKITVRDNSFNYIKGLNFEVYEQILDVNFRPAAGKSVGKGVIDEVGVGTLVFSPDPRTGYAIKIYDKNASVGEFWFFDDLKIACGSDTEVIKYLSALNIILRNGDGELRKNQTFSLYTQKFDVDGNPVKEKKDLVSSKLNTTEFGELTVYLAPDHKYDPTKRGKYIFSVKGVNGNEFFVYDIDVFLGADTTLEYTLSDVVLEFSDSEGNKLKTGTSVEIYEQERDVNRDNILGKRIKTFKIDEDGRIFFEYGAGAYAAKIKDDTGKGYFIFWDIKIRDNQREIKEIILNTVKIKAIDERGEYMEDNFSIDVYGLKKNDFGLFKRGTKIKSFKVGVEGFAEFSIAPGPYLFVITKDKKLYGKALYIAGETSYDLTLMIDPAYLSTEDSAYRISVPVPAKKTNLAKRLAGHILLQVEENGEAWYVDHKTELRYYLKNGGIAYGVMRDFGLGITNEDLSKIPIGMDDRFSAKDTDGDGLFDKMEEAIGTDLNDIDSDNDGYTDGEEVRGGYNPLGDGKMKVDHNFASKLKGKILLQVHSRGEAWYINPQDGKRYYMKDGDSAFNIMRFLSLGITNDDLDEIEEGEL